MSLPDSVPLVSVIVPVRNGGERIRQCIEALLQQDYPKDRYEVLIIDNGSTDGTQDIIRSYPVTFLEETTAASPYVARNLGLRQARGQICAFTDATCVACESWLSEGVQTMARDNADLVAGNVEFELGAPPKAAELYDSITYVQVKKAVEEKSTAFGGNMFVGRTVFDHLGAWPTQRSGGDTRFTQMATHAGYHLTYSESACVYYPARNILSLLKKTMRVSRRQPYYWNLRQHQYIAPFAKCVLGLLLPPPREMIMARMREHALDTPPRRRRSIMRVAWLVAIASRLALLPALLTILLRGNHQEIG